MTPAELADRGGWYASETSWTEHADWLVNHWPDIAAALRQADTDRARLATAEADADRLAKGLQLRDDGIGIDWEDDEALMLHEEAVARREQP